MEEISHLTGVTVECGTGDGSADVHLLVCVQKLALIDLLNSIWSCVSYRGAEWSLVKTSDSPPSYRICRGMAAQRLGDELRGWLEAEFGRQASIYLEAARMSPDERATYLRSHAGDVYPAQQSEAMLSAALASARKWSGLALFQQALSPEQRAAVLGSGGSARMPMSELGSAGQSFVDGVQARENVVEIDAGGTRHSPPPVTDVEFATQASGPRQVPTLMIWLDRQGTRSGYGYVGGMPLDMRLDDMMASRWMLRGDGLMSPDPIEPQAGRGAEPKCGTGARRMAGRVNQLAWNLKRGVVARLTSSRSTDPGHPEGASLTSYLAALRAEHAIMSKWRNGVLLLTSQTWPTDEIDDEPWLVAARLLQAQRSSSRGLLMLANLARLAQELTSPQLKRLALTWPTADAIDAIRPLLLAWWADRAALSSVQGRNGHIATEPEQEASLAVFGAPAQRLTVTERVLPADDVAGTRREVCISASPPGSAAGGVRKIAVLHYPDHADAPATGRAIIRPAPP